MGALVFHVMTESPREKYLVSVVDVATHTEFARLKKKYQRIGQICNSKQGPCKFLTGAPVISLCKSVIASL